MLQRTAGIKLKEEQNMKEQLTVERQLRLATINCGKKFQGGMFRKG